MTTKLRHINRYNMTGTA